MVDPNTVHVERIYSLLTAGTGIVRTRNAELAREAGERAKEGRDQVGLYYINEEESSIPHPSQAECEARLGPAWKGKGVGELMVWNYEYLDPILALVDYTRSDGGLVGLLNSEDHRRVLMDPSYTHWGIDIYTELPEGLEEWRRRYYCGVWLSKSVPSVVTPPIEKDFTDVPPTHPFYGDIMAMKRIGVARGYPDGSFHPSENVTRAQMMAFMNRERKAPPG
jgi:hypothetical protein